MAIDKVLLEVLNNRFTGIVEEMGYVIHRASFTVFVKETWDFDSALVATNGEIFCYPRNIGVTNMLGMSMAAAIESIPHYEPGDVIVTNHPHKTRGSYASRGASSIPRTWAASCPAASRPRRSTSTRRACRFLRPSSSARAS